MSLEQAEILPWMDSDYFKSILIKYEGRDDLQLKEFNVSAGTKKGENFASAIYRVTLNYLLQSPKEMTFIIKTRPDSLVLSAMLDEMGTFALEANFYENVLADCEKLIGNFKIAPRWKKLSKYRNER